MPLEFLSIDFNVRREMHRDPTWAQVRSAIDLLDGKAVSMVRLSTLAGTSLSIGGGQDDQYVVSGLRGSGASTPLMDPVQTGEDVGVREGRADRVFAANMVVTKALVIRAAEVFFRNGSFDPALSWDTTSHDSAPSAAAAWTTKSRAASSES